MHRRLVVAYRSTLTCRSSRAVPHRGAGNVVALLDLSPLGVVSLLVTPLAAR